MPVGWVNVSGRPDGEIADPAVRQAAAQPLATLADRVGQRRLDASG